MKDGSTNRSLPLLLAAAFLTGILAACLTGCEEKPTGYEVKPPPVGGPPKGASRKPPGEVDGPATR